MERRLGPPDAELARGARLVRRLRTLTEGLERERARVAAAAARRRPRARAARRPPAGAGEARPARRRAGWGWGDAEEEAGATEAAQPPGSAGDGVEDRPVEVPTAEKLAAELKQLYRRLARLLHPDLARSDEERHRLGDLMARVNAAWAAQDRTALELMAEKVGAGEPPGELATRSGGPTWRAASSSWSGWRRR